MNSKDLSKCADSLIPPVITVMDSPTGLSLRKSISRFSSSSEDIRDLNVLELRRNRSDSFYSEMIEEPIKEVPFGWVIVFAVFMIHAIVDGVSGAFGSLYSHFVDHYGGGVSETTFCQSMLYGITYGCGPLASYLCDTYGLRPVALVGSLLASSGYFLSIFAKNVWQLTLSYGVLTGLGFGFMYLPAIVSVSSWFEEHRALATSIAVCGNGVGFFVFPSLTTFLLKKYDLPGCLLIISGVILNGLIFSALLRTPPCYMKHSRHKHSLSPGKAKSEKNICKRISQYFHQLDWKLLSNWKFIIYGTSSFFGALSCYVPSVFLSDRAEKQSDIDSQQASFLFAFLGGASIVGRLVSGILSDRNLVNSLFMYSGACIVSGVATSLSVLWHFYFSHAIYASIYGVTSGVIVALQSVVLADIVGVDKISNAFGILLFVQGVAVFIGPPFAGLIIERSGFTLCFLVAGAIMCLSGLFLLLIPTRNGLKRLCARC